MHASQRTSCLALASFLSHLLNKLIFSLLFVGRRSSKCPHQHMQKACKQQWWAWPWHIYLNDTYCCTLYLLRTHVSREVQGQTLLDCNCCPMYQHQWHSHWQHPAWLPHLLTQHTESWNVPEKNTHARLCGQKMPWSWMKSAHHQQAPDYANIHWSQVAVGLEDVAATTHAAHQEWRNYACKPGDCCLMMRSAM